MTPDPAVYDLLAPYETILLGLVGSRLYGFANDESDYDWKGVYRPSTLELLGLHEPKGTVHSVDPDVQVHELGKFVGLALKCNPTTLELLWLPEYAILTDPGQVLVDARDAFLWSKPMRGAFAGHARQLLGWITGKKAEPNTARKLDVGPWSIDVRRRATSAPLGGVRASYFDYARQQFLRLVDRDGTYKSKLRKRTAKHTRHLFRLMEQGEQLLTTGAFDPRIADPERIIAMGELDVDEMVPIAEAALARFDKLPSVLPVAPDTERIGQLLIDLRLDQLYPGLAAFDRALG